MAIRPIYVQAAAAMRDVRYALGAELWVSELLGALRLGFGPVAEEDLDAATHGCAIDNPR